MEAALPRSSSYADDQTTRTLLRCGILAGPVFVTVGLIQAFTIPGFDLTHHYLSQLSSGELGWIQMANFVITGLLTIAAAVGVRRALGGGTLGRVAPVLLGVFGVGLAAAGVFVADPANGFPPGTPDAIPTHQSWHSILHGVSAILSFVFLVGACFTLGYRFARQREWGWAVYSAATGVVSFGLPALPNPWGGVFLFVGASIAFIWMAALSVRLTRQLR
jgi:succinate dehydrogenase/fumarate reductase cytochrome b subunit